MLHTHTHNTNTHTHNNLGSEGVEMSNEFHSMVKIDSDINTHL